MTPSLLVPRPSLPHTIAAFFMFYLATPDPSRNFQVNRTAKERNEKVCKSPAWRRSVLFRRRCTSCEEWHPWKKRSHRGRVPLRMEAPREEGARKGPREKGRWRDGCLWEKGVQEDVPLRGMESDQNLWFEIFVRKNLRNMCVIDIFKRPPETCKIQM